MDRYCFERERIHPDRHEGVRVPEPVYDGVHLTHHTNREMHSMIYVVYDRQRGLYDPVCYVSQAADVTRIVDALNTHIIKKKL